MRKRIMQNAECRMQNAECRVQNAKCRMQNAKCKMQNAKCRMQNAELLSVILSSGVNSKLGIVIRHSEHRTVIVVTLGKNAKNLNL